MCETADDVQAGRGRTGKHSFGIEHHGVPPDIVVMAKGIAGGFPVGATMTAGEIAEGLEKLGRGCAKGER